MLLRWVDEDREKILDFLRRFIRAKRPNPPGDTRDAADYVCSFLDLESISYQIVAPQSEMPNIVSAFDGSVPGRHLVLNGHIDVFPVGDASKWNHDPWGGKIVLKKNRGIRNWDAILSDILPLLQTQASKLL